MQCAFLGTLEGFGLDQVERCRLLKVQPVQYGFPLQLPHIIPSRLRRTTTLGIMIGLSQILSLLPLLALTSAAPTGLVPRQDASSSSEGDVQVNDVFTPELRSALDQQLEYWRVPGAVIAVYAPERDMEGVEVFGIKDHEGTPMDGDVSRLNNKHRSSGASGESPADVAADLPRSCFKHEMGHGSSPGYHRVMGQCHSGQWREVHP